jgi:hypothetical protein
MTPDKKMRFPLKSCENSFEMEKVLKSPCVIRAKGIMPDLKTKFEHKL